MPASELNPDELRQLAQKAVGEVHVSMGSDMLDSEVTVHIPTGWSLLDTNMGGGLPGGKTVEIFGREACGKSALLYAGMAGCQKLGGIAILLDSESAFNKDLAKTYGVDTDRLTFLPTELALEDAFPTMLSLVRAFKEAYADRPILIGWDTLTGTPSSDEIEKGEEEQRGMMAQYRARVIRQGLRLITYEIARSNVCLVLISQGYEKMTPQGMSLLETSGGLAPRYYSSVRVLLKNIGLLKGSADGPPVGMKVVARFEKNKLSMPRREVASRFFYGRGFDDAYSIMDYAVDCGVIKTLGTWRSYTFAGKEIKFRDSEFRDKMNDNCGAFEEIQEKTISHYRSKEMTVR